MIHLPALGCQTESDWCWDRNVVAGTTAAATQLPPGGSQQGCCLLIAIGMAAALFCNKPSNNFWVNWLWPTSPATKASTNSCRYLALAIYLAAATRRLDLWETLLCGLDESRLHCVMPVQLANLDFGNC